MDCFPDERASGPRPPTGPPIRPSPSTRRRSSGPMPMAESTATSRSEEDQKTVRWTVFPTNAAMAHLLIPRVEDEIRDLAERAVAARAASSSSSSLAARPTCDDDRHTTPNSAMTASTLRVDTPLMDISATASSEEEQKTVRGTVFPTNARTDRRPRSRDCGETRLALVTGRLGDLHGHGTGWRVDALGQGGVGIAPALGRARVQPGPEKAFALASRIARSKARANTDAMSPGPVSISCSRIASQGRIFASVHSFFSMVGLQPHGIPDWTAPAGARPGRGSWPPTRANFQN